MAPQTSRNQSRDFDNMRYNLESGGRWRENKTFLNNRERSLERPQIIRWQDSEAFAKPLQRRVRSTSPLGNYSNEREWLHETSPTLRDKFQSRVLEQGNRRDGVGQRLLEQKAASSSQLVPAKWRENSGHVTKDLKPQFGESRRDLQVQVSPTLSPIYAPPIHQEIITHHRHVNHGFETMQPYHYETVNKGIDFGYYPSHFSCRHYETPGDSARIHIGGSNMDDTIVYESTRVKSRGEDFLINSKGSQPICIRTEYPRRHISLQTHELRNENEYIHQRNNDRSYFDEAWNGASKDWTIIDVPPGTKRVRLEGIGGESQEITWQKYSGVRRSNNMPDREQIESNEALTKRPQISDKEHTEIMGDSTNHKTSGLELQLAPDHKARGNMGIYEYNDLYSQDSYERHNRNLNPSCQKSDDLWTEITKDLVVRQAIVEMGYEFEETRFFFYIFRYLPYEEIVYLIELSNQIRHNRHKRLQEINWERESEQDYSNIKGIYD